MRIFLIITLIIISSVKYIAQQNNQTSFSKILKEEINRHPKSQVEDIYKFIHQAALGSEHAVKDTIAVKKWLETEIAGLDYSLTENLTEPLSPDGNLIRLNLRPYLKANFDVTMLLNAFVKTANNYKGSIKKLKSYWKIALTLSKTEKLNFTSEEINNFFESQSKKGFPAVHHSELYRGTYKPAYRVVDLQYISFFKK